MRTSVVRGLALMVVAACSSPTSPAPTAPVETHTPVDERSRDWLPIVDSHVHLAYYPVADQLAKHGVSAAVDLAAPESALGTKYPIKVIQAGPMLTHPNGYPLDAWGSDGYGIGCDSPSCVTDAIDRLQQEGARIIKIALDDDGLDERLARYAAIHAHQRHMLVVVHALSDESVRFAAEIDADALAHTPVEALSEATITAWQVRVRKARPIDGMAVTRDQRPKRAVITTLAAFGGSPIAIDNLRRLRAAGLVVLYGTDLGNLRVDGLSTDEIELMKSAGMTDADVRTSMTSAPWSFWRFDELGPIPGKPAEQ